MVDKILNWMVGYMESTGYAMAASRLASLGMMIAKLLWKSFIRLRKKLKRRSKSL